MQVESSSPIPSRCRSQRAKFLNIPLLKTDRTGKPDFSIEGNLFVTSLLMHEVACVSKLGAIADFIRKTFLTWLPENSPQILVLGLTHLMDFEFYGG